MRRRPNRAASAIGVLALFCMPRSAAAWDRFSLDDALLPERVSLTLEHRARYEFFDDPFRVGRTGDEQALVLRTLVHGRVRLFEGLTLGAELQDSRAELTGDTPLSPSIVNSVELLRAYIAVDLPETLGGTVSGQAGLLTLDVGSRRFVARNRFRNTINAFAGIDLDWKGTGELAGRELRAFWTLPVQRLPNEADRLRRNEIEFDHENLDVQFWGVFGATDLPGSGRSEFFFFGLHERDGSGQPTQDRTLYTPGFRWFQAPETGQFDHQFESVIQFGHSRASTTATRDLDHFAHFHHVEFGYSIAAPCAPRIALQYDYASGDDDPTDGKNQRFDSLYGARRFDFGPTGIYGPFARANLHSPGIRFQATPIPSVTSFLAFRAYWLASDRDAWTPSGVQDPSGHSGSYVGSQIEFSARWKLLSDNLTFETGYAHLFAGSFIDRAPNSNREGDSDYMYSQVVVNF